MSHAEDHAGTRRDFLYYATAGAGTVAAGASVWTLVDQMNPTADVRALSSIFVDISGVAVGTQLTVKWRGKPVFIRNRTPQEIESAKSVKLAELPDTASRNMANEKLDASDANRTKKGKEQWMVLIGICTHLGCIPKGQTVSDVKGDYRGWFCPCHGSHYDTSGRIRKGPAPRNLDVPPFDFVSDTKIKIG